MQLFSKVRGIIARLNTTDAPTYDLKQLSTAVAILDENPAYKQAVEDMLSDLVGKWLGSKPDATEERERLYLQAHALSQLDGHFSSYIARNLMKDKKNDG